MTLRRAKDELKADGEVKYIQSGGGKEKVWIIERAINVGHRNDRQEETKEQMTL